MKFIPMRWAQRPYDIKKLFYYNFDEIANHGLLIFLARHFSSELKILMFHKSCDCQ